MMNYDNYINRATYPHRSDFNTYNVYLKGNVIGRGISRDEKNEHMKNHPGCIVESEFDQEKFLAVRDAYYAEEGRMIDLFWSDTFDELGIDKDHPKAHLLRGIAWEQGHSSGLQEVFYKAEQLADFLR